MNDRPKWICAVCTYENWPASVKCTLCRASQPTSLIDEEIKRLQLPSENASANYATVSPESEQPIQCTSCAHWNKSSSVKCEQCFHLLKESPGSVGPPSPKSTPSLPQRQHSEIKWACPQCTYENWPKSRRCVMCYGPPPVSLTNISNDREVIIDSDRHTGHSTSNIFTSNSRPKSLSSSLPMKTRDKLWLAACIAVIQDEVTPIERYILSSGRIDRKLTKKECRYLESIVPSFGASCSQSSGREGFHTSCEDNQSISLTTPDNNRIGVTTEDTGFRFRAGLTLVDLALRQGRTDLINLFIALSGLQTTSSAVTLTKHTGSRSAVENTILSRVRARSQLSAPCHSTANRPSNNACLPSKVGVNRSKWMPCQASPLVAKELRDHIARSVKRRSGDFPCVFLTETGTFALPYSITKLPQPVKYLLLSELCDAQAQSELEEEAKAINWWFVPGQKQASRLFALWNRTAGDCLLDSVLQACWGIFDRENCLRQALAHSLRACEASFYQRWRDYEAQQAACHYILDEVQCRRDWDSVLTAADQPGGALEQIHVFVLSHILRRPIIVYGVKYIKNYRDEPIGIANFQGIYLPLLCERTSCSTNPIVLGYTRGHFTALVPVEPAVSAEQSPPGTSRGSPAPTTTAAAATDENAELALPQTDSSSLVYLPLVDRQGNTLPVHFIPQNEAEAAPGLLRDWLDVLYTRRGLALTRLRLGPRHPLVERMLDDWLDSYRQLTRLSSQADDDRPPSSSSASSSSSTASDAEPH